MKKSGTAEVSFRLFVTVFYRKGNKEMEKKMSKVPFFVCFSVGAVLFSSHAGGGFASGNQAFQNFSGFGWVGVFTCLLAMLLFTMTMYLPLLIALSGRFWMMASTACSAVLPLTLTVTLKLTSS